MLERFSFLCPLKKYVHGTKQPQRNSRRHEYEFEEECEPCEGAEWQHAGFEGYPLEDDDD